MHYRYSQLAPSPICLESHMTDIACPSTYLHRCGHTGRERRRGGTCSDSWPWCTRQPAGRGTSAWWTRECRWLGRTACQLWAPYTGPPHCLQNLCTNVREIQPFWISSLQISCLHNIYLVNTCTCMWKRLNYYYRSYKWQTRMLLLCII